MTDSPSLSGPGAGAVRRLVPMAHVMDVERSLRFYALLGFEQRGIVKNERGWTNWAHAQSDQAEIMFAQADPEPAPEDQAVLFYMYSDDLAGLRKHLLDSGLHDGGRYCGQSGPKNGRSVLFDISHPFYMQKGELRVADPDGYCILIGQI